MSNAALYGTLCCVLFEGCKLIEFENSLFPWTSYSGSTLLYRVTLIDCRYFLSPPIKIPIYNRVSCLPRNGERPVVRACDRTSRPPTRTCLAESPLSNKSRVWVEVKETGCVGGGMGLWGPGGTRHLFLVPCVTTVTLFPPYVSRTTRSKKNDPSLSQHNYFYSSYRLLYNGESPYQNFFVKCPTNVSNSHELGTFV